MYPTEYAFEVTEHAIASVRQAASSSYGLCLVVTVLTNVLGEENILLNTRVERVPGLTMSHYDHVITALCCVLFKVTMCWQRFRALMV